MEPFAQIPAPEKWPFDNPSALDAVQVGIEQAAEGKTRNLGSFAQYANEESD